MFVQPMAGHIDSIFPGEYTIYVYEVASLAWPTVALE